MQGVFARLVGEIGHRPAVRRPGRVALHDPRRPGQVADVAFFGRHGQDLAAGLEDGPGAVRRQAGRRDAAADFDVVRPDLGQVALQRDGNGRGPARGRVEEVQGAELLDDDAAGAGRGRLEVQAAVRQGLVDLFRGRVVDEERHGALAVGQEVDLVADPERVRVVGVLARDLLDREVGERHEPDGRRLAALVALPGRLPLLGGDVGQPRAVGGVGARDGGRQRQGFGKAALEPDGVEGRQAHGPAGPARTEQDALAVGRPARDLVRVRMVGQAPRDAPAGRDHEDVGIAVVLAGEGDERPVRRETRQALIPDVPRQAGGPASLAPDDPEVAGAGEDDVRPAEGRVLGQDRFGGRGGGRRGREERGGQDESEGGGQGALGHGVPPGFKWSSE